MGLDWIVQDKVIEGRRVDPAETAGFERLDPASPEAIAIMTARLEGLREDCPVPGPKPEAPEAPGGLTAVLEALTGAGRRRSRAYQSELEAWQRQKAFYDQVHGPLEGAVSLFTEGDPPAVIRWTAPDRKDALAGQFGGGASFYDFRGGLLFDEDNDVTAYAARELDLYVGVETGLDREPEEMLVYADEFERALNHYLAHAPNQDEDSIDVVRSVIPWLRFWGRAGHGYVVWV